MIQIATNSCQYNLQLCRGLSALKTLSCRESTPFGLEIVKCSRNGGGCTYRLLRSIHQIIRHRSNHNVMDSIQQDDIWQITLISIPALESEYSQISPLCPENRAWYFSPLLPDPDSILAKGMFRFRRDLTGVWLIPRTKSSFRGLTKSTPHSYFTTWIFLFLPSYLIQHNQHYQYHYRTSFQPRFNSHIW